MKIFTVYNCTVNHDFYSTMSCIIVHNACIIMTSHVCIIILKLQGSAIVPKMVQYEKHKYIHKHTPKLSVL